MIDYKQPTKKDKVPEGHVIEVEVVDGVETPTGNVRNAETDPVYLEWLHAQP